MENASVKKAKKKLFFLLEKVRKEPIQRTLAELIYNQEAGSQYLVDLQSEKLKSLIHHCFHNIKFYRALYSRAGVSPAEIQGVEDLIKLPSITKDDVKKNIEGLIAGNGPMVFPVKTSGSTGSPLKFYKDRIASAYSYAAMYRGLGWYGIDICEKEAYLWGIPIARKEREIARLKDFILNRFREKTFNLSDAVFTDFYQKMKRRKPSLLSGYSTFLYEFSRFIKRNKLDAASIRPKVIKYTAEMMYTFQKESIEQVFECPVVGEYGSAEIGVMAFQCAKHNYHVFTDCCVLEFKKKENVGLYEIIATNLNARGFPLVRYRTGDLVEKPGFSHCSCGLPFPVMESIIGRSADIVITPEGKRIHCNIFSYIIKYLIKDGHNFDRILFIQESVLQLKVLVNPFDAEKSDFQIKLTSLVYDKISPAMQVVINPFSNSEHFEQRGKLRYFISKLKENDTP